MPRVPPPHPHPAPAPSPRCANNQGSDGKWNKFGGRLAWDSTAICSNNPAFGGRGSPKQGDDYAAAPNIDHTQEHIRQVRPGAGRPAGAGREQEAAGDGVGVGWWGRRAGQSLWGRWWSSACSPTFLP